MSNTNVKILNHGINKALPRTGHEGPGGIEVKLYSFFNLGARLGEWSTPRRGRFTLRKDPVPIV
jgi:hypothetical protein